MSSYLGWGKLRMLLGRALTWTGMQTFASLVATTADINAGTFDGVVGGTTPAAGTFSPVKAKGPAIITTFAGTVTATASTTVTFSSAADAILAGYSATNPMLGTTLISNALTRYIVSWTNATTCVVDSSVTWAGTAITSTQLPIATFVNSAGVVVGWINAAKQLRFITGASASTIAPTGDVVFEGSDHHYINVFSPVNKANFINLYGAVGRVGFIGWEDGSRGNVFVMGASAGGGGEIVVDGVGGGNIGFNTRTFGTSAAKVLAIGSGTAPTTSPADAAQMWVADYLAGAGDARLHIMGEGSAAAKTVLGSGKVGITGTTGGLTRQLSEAVSAALSGASGSIAVNVPSGARILGVQLRVDTAITSDNATKTWAATYANTPTTAITSGQVFDANTKFNAIHPAYEITTGTVTITITAAAGLFTGGVVRAICYYESIDAMASL